MREKIAAVNPDLFMTMRFTPQAYRRALNQLVTSLNNPPKTLAQMHTLIGRKHPRLQQRFADLYPEAAPEPPPEREPEVLYRGTRCVICGRVVRNAASLMLGCHPECAARLRQPASSS